MKLFAHFELSLIGFILLTPLIGKASSVRWQSTTDGIEQFAIESALLSGVFVARDLRELDRGFGRHGLRELRFRPTETDLQAPATPVGQRRRHQGHLNLYRVYSASDTLGSLRDELATAERLADGARLTWPANENRPVAISASWRLTGPGQIDLLIEAVPHQDLTNFEILPATYGPVEMVKYAYLQRGGKAQPTIMGSSRA